MAPPRIAPRRSLDALPAYLPGKPSEDADVFKVSSNESPFPPPQVIADAIATSLQQINRYPDMGVVAPRRALAGEFDLPVSRVAVGAGSVAVLGQLVHALCEPGDEVVYAWRSFEAYPVVTGVAAATPVQVPLDSHYRHDLEAMAAAITERTRIVILCSPNNPTGTTISQAEVDALLAQVPEHVLVVIDEAYREFVDGAEHVDALATFRAHHNVAVLRTFSKVQGLAGLRIGYGFAPEAVVEGILKVAPPFGVSLPAQAAAIASLTHEAEVEFGHRVRALVGERQRVRAGLLEQGWADRPGGLPDSQGNFVFLPLCQDGPEFMDFAMDRGLIVRCYGHDGVRVTIDVEKANDRFLEICREWIGRSGTTA